jgi:hypothetical protein
MMTTAVTTHVWAADQRAREHHLRACVRSLETRGWQQRLAPLAEAMVRLRLVRGRNEQGAPVRHLDAELLRATMCRLVAEGDDSAYLVYQLVVEGMDAAWVAAERGVSQVVLTEQLRNAVRRIAGAYEDLAYGRLNASPAERVSTALARRGG